MMPDNAPGHRLYLLPALARELAQSALWL